jgi:hypothetical protein
MIVTVSIRQESDEQRSVSVSAPSADTAGDLSRAIVDAHVAILLKRVSSNG